MRLILTTVIWLLGACLVLAQALTVLMRLPRAVGGGGQEGAGEAVAVDVLESPAVVDLFGRGALCGSCYR